MKKLYTTFILSILFLFIWIYSTDTFKYFKEQTLNDVKSQWELVDMYGKPISNNDLLGKHYLIGFGYTNCIDICPVSMETLSAILDNIEERYGEKVAKQFNAYYVTIDPIRDTPEIMLDAIQDIFHERLVGLTGTDEQIAKIAKNFKVTYSSYGDLEKQIYTMRHTTYLYLVDKNGKYKMQFSHKIEPSMAVDYIAKKIDMD